MEHVGKAPFNHFFFQTNPEVGAKLADGPGEAMKENFAG